MTLDLDRASLSDAVRALADHTISSVELLNAQLDRVDIFNPSVNAVVAFDVDRAMAHARAVDDQRVNGVDVGPLAGISLTIKDTWETSGLVTTAGAQRYADHVPENDADVVAGLRSAGATVYGKTNVPLFAGDHQTYNDVYGLTRNPWDPDRTAGGSSGGAAVSVACGFSLGEFGSDIGGSIRVPAHFNGLFGLKPSWGVVSDRGHIPGPPGTLAPGDLAVMGPLARTAEDLTLLLDASLRFGAMKLGGATPVPGAALPAAEPVDLVDLSVGLWLDDPVAPVDAATGSALERAAAALAEVGASLDESIRPRISSGDLHDTYSRLLSAVNGAGWPDRVRSQFIAEAAQHEGPLDAGDPETFALRLARDGTADHAAWLVANERRVRAEQAWSDVFEQVDVMLMPVSQTPAFPHDIEVPYRDRVVRVDRGPDQVSERAYHELLFWAGLATMPLLPSVVLPLGPVDGLPIGVQLVGPRWSDRQLLAIAEAVSAALGLAFVPPTLITG